MPRSTLPFSVLAALLLGGCDSECGGTQSYATTTGGVVTSEDCSNFGGSHGNLYSDGRLASIVFDSNAESVSDSVGTILDLTPYTAVFFRQDHLEDGAVLDLNNLSGFGVHDSTASGALPTEAPLTAGSLQITGGPRGSDSMPRYRVVWDLTYGDNFQRHTGNKWIEFDQTSSSLVPDNLTYPPDFNDVDEPGPPGPECHITGDLTLDSPEALVSTAPLCTVSGTLTLTGTLADVSGIGPLTSVGHLAVEQSNLQNLDGLDSLEQIEHSLIIRNNSTLSSISGISGAQGPSTSILIADNQRLSELTLPANTTTLQSFTLQNNRGLTRVIGTNTLVSVDALDISGNWTLEHLDLSSLTSASESVSIRGNGVLQTLRLDALEQSNSIAVEGGALTSLEGLAGLREVGSLTIGDLPNLTSLTPLRDLHTVSASLSLRRLNGLTTLAGLDSLAEAPSIIIQHNDALESVDSFAALTHVEQLRVTDLPSLTTLDGFDSLTDAGEIYISSTRALTSLPMLASLTSTSSLTVEFADALPSLFPATQGPLTLRRLHVDSLPALTSLSGSSVSVTETLHLEDATALTALDLELDGAALHDVHLELLGLTSLSGLAAVTSIDELFVQELPLVDLDGLDGPRLTTLTLRFLPSLTTLDGFTPTEDLERFTAQSTALLDVDALSPIASAEVHLESNPDLVSIDGLANLTSTEGLVLLRMESLSSSPPFSQLATAGHITIQETGLIATPAFPALTRVDYGLSIDRNDSLETIDGFASLTSVDHLVVRFNNALTDLTGFQSLTSAATAVTIDRNQELCQSKADQLLDQVTTPTKNSSNNKAGC